MKKARVLSLVLLTAPLFGQRSDPDQLMSALKDRKMAEQMMRLQTDERIQMYNAIVKYQPTELHYQNLLAHTYIQKMRETTDPSYLDRASKILFNVIAADAGNYEALRLRSEVELERHNFAQVVEYSAQLQRVSPEDPWNYGTLGDALMELGQYDRAADAYQKMVSLRPDLASYNRASFYRFVVGDVSGAIDIMKRAIDAGSPAAENTAWCMVELGNLFFKSGKLDEAERSYTAALRIFPKHHPAHAGLAKALAAKGNGKGAIDEFRAAQNITPMPEYASSLYDLYSAAGNKEEAAKQRAMVDVVDRIEQAANQKTNRMLALIYADHDWNLSRSLDLANAELSVRGDVYTHDVLAWALYKNKKYDEAQKSIEAALRMNTPEPMFYYHAGMIANALGKKEEAAKQLKRALELNPKFDLKEAEAGKIVRASL